MYMFICLSVCMCIHMQVLWKPEGCQIVLELEVYEVVSGPTWDWTLITLTAEPPLQLPLLTLNHSVFSALSSVEIYVFTDDQ